MLHQHNYTSTAKDEEQVANPVMFLYSASMLYPDDCYESKD
jgi:hypothetical protein